MVKILREIEGKLIYENSSPIAKIPYCDFSCQIKRGAIKRIWLNTWDGESFSKGKYCINFDDEYFVYMYDGKIYVSEIELTAQEFRLVLQKEVLSRKDKFRDELEKIKAEIEAEGYVREPIADEIQVYVWNRDAGKCVKCGSKENLEYDHIIPVSKGGSNTARNIQLLCQTCNRSKSNEIGG